ncbi:hypothetical protein [Oceanobacter mangrovi]|uniref:hypothetical protein n=1 Tax=Oceanobacter mangrovi TaxID=2862510 RepID=UPI001C8E5F5E|nr:hypothetical protein [Oceanobacter mangrovi]
MKLIGAFKRNSAMLVSIFGAAALFFSNILAKYSLSGEGYILYAKVIVLFSLAYAVVPLGMDWVITRFSSVQTEGKLLVSSNLFKILPLSLLVGGGSIVLWDQFWVRSNIEFYLVFSVSVLAGLMMLGFSIFRCIGKMYFAVFVANYWKMLILLFFVLYSVDGDSWLNSVFALFGVLTILMIWVSSLNIDFRIGDLNEVSLTNWSGAYVGVLSATFFSNFDKLIFMNAEGVDFSEYFFWSSLIYSPIIIISNYFGGKRVSLIKKTGSLCFFEKDVLMLMLLAVFLLVAYYLVLVVICVFYSDTTLPDFDILVFIGVLALGRALYGFVAQIYQAVYQVGYVYLVSLVSLSYMGVTFILAHFYNIGWGGVAVVTTFLWIGRCFAYYRGVILAGRAKV